jgi:phosphate:Na+ symporter
LLLITSHLNGTQKQLAFSQFLAKMSGTLSVLLVLLLLPFTHLNIEPQRTDNVAYYLSVIYLILQVSGAIIVTLAQKQIVVKIQKLFPESLEESLSKPKYIYPEAAQDSSIALSLIKKEQDRLISGLSNYLETVRFHQEDLISLNSRHEANIQLAQSIKQFIDEISHQDLGDQITLFIELQSRHEGLVALMHSLNSFTKTIKETKNYHTGLSAATVEGLHLVLQLMEENIDANENIELLQELTSDRSQLMDNIRNKLMTDSDTQVNDRKALFISTRIFERILWQIRQILKLQNQS